MEFFYGAPGHIKNMEDDSIIYECTYDDDPDGTCGREMAKCENIVHISVLPMKSVECPLHESLCLHKFFTKI